MSMNAAEYQRLLEALEQLAAAQVAIALLTAAGLENMEPQERQRLVNKALPLMGMT